jgi:hypothetical protein
VKQRRKLHIQTSFAKEMQKICAGSCCYAERFIFLSKDRRNYENVLIKFLSGVCISVSCELARVKHFTEADLLYIPLLTGMRTREVCRVSM